MTKTSQETDISIKGSDSSFAILYWKFNPSAPLEQRMKAVLAVLCMLLFLGSFYEASAQTCQTSGDCGNGYCCHSAMRPIGRRRQNGLTCQPRGQLNDGCLVPNSVYDVNHVYYYCPCAEGLICLGTGMIDIPLGETGVCVAP